MAIKDHPRPCGEKTYLMPITPSARGSPPPMRGKAVNAQCLEVVRGITPAHAGKRRSTISGRRSYWDHPRPCGEKVILQPDDIRKLGSPPPMRGKDPCNQHRQQRHRITPAHAGKSSHMRGNNYRWQDHPRPCGEKQYINNFINHQSGSPPPMRGKGLLTGYVSFASRITPAHAGKRHTSCPSPHPREDHPRPCGEKQSMHSASRLSGGSPPPMRGKGGQLFQGDGVIGITPAHAGKRSSSSRTTYASWDHPRPCGEKILVTSIDSNGIGSPPPMRGKDPLTVLYFAFIGITPAHAGKSFLLSARRMARMDHPRPCGEKLLAIRFYLLAQGSPPPMRGKARRASCVQAAAGITPAHAGKSLYEAALEVLRKDHPRPCGEKDKVCRSEISHSGSPPPMRGKGAQTHCACQSNRITPAHAGKSIVYRR